MAFRDALQRKAMRHAGHEEPSLHQSRDTGKNLPRPLRLDLVGRRNAHEFVVDGDVPVQQELAAIRAPTLLLWGRDDRVIDPSAVAIFQAGLSDCRTSLLNECGHMPMMERTRETAMAIKDFLQ